MAKVPNFEGIIEFLERILTKEDPDKKLILECAKNIGTEVNDIIKIKHKYDLHPAKQYTLLQYALEHHLADVVKVLLENEYIDLSNINVWYHVLGYSSILRFKKNVTQDMISTVKVLFASQKINVNADLGYGETLLHQLIRFHNNIITDMLLKDPNININIQDDFCRHPIIIAIMACNSHAYDKLFNNEYFDIESVNIASLGSREDDLAFRYNHQKSSKLLEHLLNLGADVNNQDNNGNTLLDNMIRNGNKDVIEFLINYPGINVTECKLYLMYNKHYIQSNFRSLQLDKQHINNDPLRKLLTNPNVNINIENHNGSTLLDLAIRYDDKEVIQILIGREDLKITADNLLSVIAKQHPIIPIIRVTDYVMFAMLLSNKNADINGDVDGLSPLAKAIQSNDYNAVKILTKLPNIKIDEESLELTKLNGIQALLKDINTINL